MRQMRRVSANAVMYNGLLGTVLLVVCTVLSGISFAAEKPPNHSSDVSVSV